MDDNKPFLLSRRLQGNASNKGKQWKTSESGQQVLPARKLEMKGRRKITAKSSRRPEPDNKLHITEMKVVQYNHLISDQSGSLPKQEEDPIAYNCACASNSLCSKGKRGETKLWLQSFQKTVE